MNSNSPTTLALPIILNITELHKELYRIGKKIPKRDRFGLWSEVETTCTFALRLSVRAALLPRNRKLPHIEELQTTIEVLKHLVRESEELHIIDIGPYMRLAQEIIGISQEATNWRKYIEEEIRKEPAL